MSRKTARLTVDHLAELADPVRSCLFWELGAVDRARLDESERIAQKESWLSGVLRDWGSCGRVVRVDGRTVGHIVYAPAAYFPGAAALPTEFLGGVGFKTQRAHPTTPRMRMELRTALSWKDEVELALERMWGVVRPTHKATRPIGSVRVASRD